MDENHTSPLWLHKAPVKCTGYMILADGEVLYISGDKLNPV